MADVGLKVMRGKKATHQKLLVCTAVLERRQLDVVEEVNGAYCSSGVFIDYETESLWLVRRGDEPFKRFDRTTCLSACEKGAVTKKRLAHRE